MSTCRVRGVSVHERVFVGIDVCKDALPASQISQIGI